MIIELQNLGKRYNRNWIFRHLDYTFQSGTAYAITGANGSGKSTLLQVLAGAVTLSEGKVQMMNGDEGLILPDQLAETNKHLGDTNLTSQIRNHKSEILPEHHYRHLAMAAPYLELIEEMTLTEFLRFHFQFKPILPGYSVASIIEFMQLQKAANRQIRHYSSGMKQRVKLAQAVFSHVPVMLLDEPLTNLDVQGIEFYYCLIENFCRDRLLIICSNSEPEIHFCEKRLAIEEFAT